MIIAQSYHPHAFGLTPSFSTIPQELKGGHWCVWIAVPRQGKPGKYDKLPHNGYTYISTREPENWLTYEQAEACYKQNLGKYNGIGRLVETGLVFLDIDTGTDPQPYFDAVDTYWERSPSNEGYRGVLVGDLDVDIAKPIEIYAGNAPRFVTITGQPVNESPVRHLTPAITHWVRSLVGSQKKKAAVVPNRPEVIEGFELPYPMNTLGLGDIPLVDRDGNPPDRSREMMRIATMLAHKNFSAQEIYSFLAITQWMTVALDHRDDNHDKALDYLWKATNDAIQWVGESPRGDSVEGYYARHIHDGLLDELERKPPRYNSDHWPNPLSTVSEFLADSAGMDRSATAFAALWSASAALDQRTRIIVKHGWDEPMILWACLIGDPSTMKTPATKPFTSMLHKIEIDYDAVFQRQEAAYRRAMQVFQNNEVPEDGEPMEEPARPIRMHLVVNEGTGQGMRNLLLDRPRGCAVFFDEMTDFLMRMTSRNRENPDRGFWVQSYQGNSFGVSLATSGFSRVPNLAMPILGSVQPQVLAPIGKQLHADGMMQRFIPVPLHDARVLDIGDEPPPFLDRSSEWDALLRFLVILPPLQLRVSPASLEKLNNYRKELHNTLVSRRMLHLSNAHSTALGKTPGTVVRIAGLFHLIEHRTSGVIDEACFDKALALVNGYVRPAMDYLYNLLFGLGDEPFHLWLADTVLITEGDIITLRDIKRSGKRRPEMDASDAVRNQRIIDGMTVLEHWGWVTFGMTDTKSTWWMINPEKKKEHRKRIEERKKRLEMVNEQVARNNEIYHNKPRPDASGST